MAIKGSSYKKKKSVKKNVSTIPAVPRISLMKTSLKTMKTPLNVFFLKERLKKLRW